VDAFRFLAFAWHSPDAHQPDMTARAATSTDGEDSWGMWIRRIAVIANGFKCEWLPCRIGDRRQNNNHCNESTRRAAIGTATNSRFAASRAEAAMAPHQRVPRVMGNCELLEGDRDCNWGFCARTRPRARWQHHCHG
jgi:hypothetical protein